MTHDTLDGLAIHTVTTRSWSAGECIKHYAAAGIPAITFWRDVLDGRNPEAIGRQARDAGLGVVSVARGGFFFGSDWEDDNKLAVDQTAALGAPVLVLVCGADPALPLEESRKIITERIGMLLGYAQRRNVLLAIEPLHPMYADTRSAINTIQQAHDVCDALDSPANLGLALDVYHTWWDPALEAGIRKTGATNRLFAFHVCDWKVPTTDLLNDRGLMGEGCIPIRKIRGWVEESGFQGFNEVEIFSHTYWAQDPHAYLEKIKEAYKKHV